MTKEGHPRVPYGMTVHGEHEIKAVVKVLETSTQMGPNVREMEDRTALLFDKKYGIMVNSGSSALLLAVDLLALPQGSEILTPVCTFATTVSAITKNGHTPSFIDIEPDTYCIDAQKIERQITTNTRALLIPNLLGNLPDWGEIYKISRRHNLYIIEDSADTLGATIDGVSSGHFSDISITSFYGSHIINCAGTGGILCVNDEEQDRRARILRSWGRSSSVFVDSEDIRSRFITEIDGIQYDAKFIFEEPAYNLEPSEIGAAFGLVQLEKLSQNIQARINNFTAHTSFFRKYEDFFILPRQMPNVRTAWLAYPLQVRDEAPFSRTQLQIFLEERNIQTRVIFTGNITRQPGFKSIQMVKSNQGYPNADAVMRGGILFACHHGLTSEMMDHIHSSFDVFMAQYA